MKRWFAWPRVLAAIPGAAGAGVLDGRRFGSAGLSCAHGAAAGAASCERPPQFVTFSSRCPFRLARAMKNAKKKLGWRAFTKKQLTILEKVDIMWNNIINSKDGNKYSPPSAVCRELPSGARQRGRPGEKSVP